MHVLYALLGLWSMAQYTTAHPKDVTSTACREHLCFPASHGQCSGLHDPEGFPEQGADEKMMLSLPCSAAALMSAVSCDVEFYAILLGFIFLMIKQGLAYFWNFRTNQQAWCWGRGLVILWGKPFGEIGNAMQLCSSQIPFLILKAFLPKQRLICSISWQSTCKDLSLENMKRILH